MEKFNNLIFRTWLFLLLILAVTISAQNKIGPGAQTGKSEIPLLLGYEGYLTNSDGIPLADGNYDLTFAIYSEAEGGEALWIEDHKSVALQGGFVHLYLGEGTPANPLNLPFDQQYYIGVKIMNKEELRPRIKLNASPYSFRAGMADEVPDGSITAEKLSDGAVTNDKIRSVSWDKIQQIPAKMNVSSADSVPNVWSIWGNSKIQAPEQFLGTTDERDLVFKTNDSLRMKITRTGKVVVEDDIYMDDDNMICVKEDQERIIFDEDNDDIEIMGAHVGIGTNDPACLLHVKGTGTFGPEEEKYHIALFENMNEDGDGIAIKMNVGDIPDADHNYLTFLNKDNDIQGRIEGQTMDELRDSWEYEWETAWFVVDEVFIILNGIAAISNGPPGGPDWAEAALCAAQAIAYGIHYALWTDYVEDNVGVYIASGSGDYAECLKRLDENESIMAGDIVGVFGGKITKSTRGAHQLMVVSSAPIVLGNMPPASEEYLYEKVAFLGQVPVKVLGPVKEGDYIIPGGMNNGTGIAVSPELMTAEEYTKILGRAWDSSELEDIKLVNVAVGLNSGDIANFVQKQHYRLEQTKEEIRKLKEDISEFKQVLYQIRKKEDIRFSSSEETQR